MRACPLHKVYLACHSKHITVNSQKTIQDMKRLNILTIIDWLFIRSNGS